MTFQELYLELIDNPANLFNKMSFSEQQQWLTIANKEEIEKVLLLLHKHEEYEYIIMVRKFLKDNQK